MNVQSNDSKLYWAMIAGAILVTVGLWRVPYGDFILWPFTILGTWVHEMGHGLMAKLWGHEFMHLEIYSNGGGVAFHRGSSGRIGRAMIAAAGLLGPAFAGSLLILFGRKEKSARRILQVLGAIMALSVILYVAKTWYGYVMISLWSAVLFGAAAFASDKICYFFVQFLGVQFCINNYKDFNYMFSKGFYRGGVWMTSDTGSIAENLFLPYWFWGALIALSSVAMLGGALWFANSSGDRPGAAPKKLSPKKVDDILSELS
ncbi:MAG: M50 family metallopeptidase [Planctomycetota bacterium]|nr:M50 family metallopeptidase [Planctomycetota bacterium]